MSLFQYAVQLNEDSIDDICRFTEQYGYDFRPELESMLWDYVGSRSYPYVDMVWDYERGIPVSFSYVNGNTFEATWHFGEGCRGPFQRIWRN